MPKRSLWGLQGKRCGPGVERGEQVQLVAVGAQHEGHVGPGARGQPGEHRPGQDGAVGGRGEGSEQLRPAVGRLLGGEEPLDGDIEEPGHVAQPQGGQQLLGGARRLVAVA